MSSFHLTPDGPKRCAVDTSNPKSRGCQYGEHYTDDRAAWDRYEELMDESSFGLRAMRGESRKSELKPGEQSAQVSKAYAHWSIENDHLHNSSDIGSPQELFYYSTPQGRLELARRARGGDLRYRAIEEKLDSFQTDSFDSSVDEEEIATHVERAEQLLPRESSFIESKAQPPRRDPALRHYLVKQSHSWLARLSPEEQEALSHSTSNGFSLLQHAKGYPSEHAKSVFRHLIDENAIYDTHGLDFKAAEAEVEERKLQLSRNMLATVLSAFERAPRLDEPVVIARGTTPEELVDILGADPSSDKARLMDELELGKFNGAPTSGDSRLNNIPQSASLHGSVARSFSGESWDDDSAENRRVIVTVKARTMASPVNVSAWGTAELEVYTNPLASHTVRGGRRVGDDLFVLELEED